MAIDESNRLATREELEAVLESLRWKADMAVVNHFGDHVWLTECYSNGKQIGITDCCFVDDPCDRHRPLEGENG